MPASTAYASSLDAVELDQIRLRLESQWRQIYDDADSPTSWRPLGPRVMNDAMGLSATIWALTTGDGGDFPVRSVQGGRSPNICKFFAPLCAILR